MDSILSAMHHVLSTISKHEIIRCSRCGKSMECKANANAKCQCGTVQLNLNEMQYISENYEGCMCAECLEVLKEEYGRALGSPAVNPDLYPD